MRISQPTARKLCRRLAIARKSGDRPLQCHTRVCVCVSDFDKILRTSASLWLEFFGEAGPDEFFKVIADKAKPSGNRELHTAYLKAAKNLGALLEHLLFQLQGRTGKTSPHCYVFCRRADLLLSLDETSDAIIPSQGSGVVLLCKHHMCTEKLCQPPAS